MADDMTTITDYPPFSPGYSVTMRQDKRTGEYLAVVSTAYRNDRTDARYYMAIGESDGCWAELSPDYVARRTVTVSTFPTWLKRRFDQSMGYEMRHASRVYGR
ncbi:hypothetical protein JRC04_04965 [Mycolicibacterium sp. S2-37]|uniref:hypothetical protein n=1 Tax=Mycolicibacterium sp. S2-37 TaxID=2810297 RepID=UPI001A9442C0|nr:hypothetical protein [Mycolicibacterium sp. S2-37]MBO0676808.1 hypothetical protein [Mycolicibacterium sp. S2-37]